MTVARERVGVLVVDDEPGIRAGLRRVLDPMGYRVVLAEDGRRGLELAAREEIAIVLLDLQLPDLNGMEVLRAAKEARDRLINGDDDASGLDAMLERDLASPREGADAAIRVDPESVGLELELVRSRAGALDHGARADARERRGEARVLGVQVLEQQALGVADGLGRLRGRVGEAFLQIGGDGQVGRLHDAAAMRERFIPRHLAVATPEGAGLSPARGGERLEAERGQDTRRAGVPGVGNHEGARRLVQGAEARGLVLLADGHDGLLVAFTLERPIAPVKLTGKFFPMRGAPPLGIDPISRPRRLARRRRPPRYAACFGDGVTSSAAHRRGHRVDRRPDIQRRP